MTLKQRLENWGAWARRTGRSNQRSAESFEGGYRSPQPWHNVELWGGKYGPNARSEGFSNVDDCQAIELAWSTLEPGDKVFLRARYCKEHTVGKILFLVGGVVGKELRFHQWEEIEASAHQAIEKALRRGERNHTVLRDVGRAMLRTSDSDEAIERSLLDSGFAPA